MNPARPKGIWFTDLPARVVRGTVSPRPVAGAWRCVPYRLENLRGISLAFSPYANPGPVTLRLGVKGRHRISLVTKYPIVGNFGLRVKLTGDLCFESLDGGLNRQGHEYPEWWVAVEIFWKEADLTGQNLVLAGVPNTWLWAIRLEPVRGAPRPRRVVHPYVFTEDGDMMRLRRHSRKEDILERVLLPEDSCARIMIYSGINFDACEHMTRVGTRAGTSGDMPNDDYGANLAHNMKLFIRNRWDPMTVMRDYARRRNWEFQVYVRLRAASGVYPEDGLYDSRFFMDHPEWHMRDKEGTHICGVSYAYPQVREHVLAFYREILGYGVDGLCLCFVRGCPLVLYEPAMVRGFQKKYGLDPRTLADTDARWLDYCAEVNTEFMRQVKALAGPGQRLSGLVHGTRALNRRWGMDLPRWIREGLIDDLFIIGHTYDEHEYHVEAGPEAIEYEWFQNLPGRARVRLFPMLYPWGCLRKDPAGYQAAFWRWLDQGADGYGLWDGHGHLAYEYRGFWNLGAEPRTPLEPRSRLTNRYVIREINGFRHDRYSVLESW
jgi:hypothetical protein